MKVSPRSCCAPLSVASGWGQGTLFVLPKAEDLSVKAEGAWGTCLTHTCLAQAPVTSSYFESCLWESLGCRW